MKELLNQHYALSAYQHYFHEVANHIAMIEKTRNDPQPILPGKAMTPTTAKLLAHMRVLDEAYGAAADYIETMDASSAQSITAQHSWFQAYNQSLSNQALLRQQKIEEDRERDQAAILSLMRETTDAYTEPSSYSIISSPPPVENLPAPESPMIEYIPAPASASKPKPYASLTQEEKWNNGFMRAVSPIEQAPDSPRLQSLSHQDRLRTPSPAAYYGR